MKPQDEVQHWRRVRKAMAGILGDADRGTLTARDLRQRIEAMRDLAQEREKAWIEVVLDNSAAKEGAR